MGAKIIFSRKRKISNENIADITFKSSKLKGIHLKKKTVSNMIDEIPIFCVLASFAKGVSSFTGASELKYKESNRINSIYDNLLACKINVKKKNDGLRIIGNINKPDGGEMVIKTKFDHRIAMSFLIMGTSSKKRVKIDDESSIKTSFPNFKTLMNGLGAKLN